MPLTLGARTWTCPRNHSFDVARSGYLNLLQPQDRRSRNPGDPRQALEARARLLAAGIGQRVLEAFVRRAAAALASSGGAVADLGCGFGDALGLLCEHREVAAVGIDLAAPAVDVAARRYPAVTWVAANADRRLPLLDASVSLIVSLNARRNPAECERVIPPGGHLLVAVPAAEDLTELREAVQGTAVARTRAVTVVTEHEPGFVVVDRGHAREQHRLGSQHLQDLLRGTYRGERAREAERVRALDDLTVTLATDFVLLRRR